ncbi:hypothetical protein [Quadrisphaera sp. KR29]|uniref:hypothetical protein n=1 Tax=Quadrisphaera sp. KR29 TaxID=3461391 RepID=UPI0040439D12
MRVPGWDALTSRVARPSWGRRPQVAAPAWPDVGPAVPALVLRLVAGAVAAVLVAGAIPGSWQLAVAVGAVVALRPSPPVVVALVLVLAGAQVLQPLLPVQPRFFALLAGLHLLHVLTALARVLPARARVQLAAVRRPLARWAAVQAGTQVVALAVLVALPGPDGGLVTGPVPVLGVVGAVVLLATALVLLLPPLRRPSR